MLKELFIYYGVDWVWYGFSILALYLLARKNKYGFICLLVSDAAGFYMAYAMKSWATLFGTLIYVGIGIAGWINWNKESKDKKQEMAFRAESCMGESKSTPFS